MKRFSQDLSAFNGVFENDRLFTISVSKDDPSENNEETKDSSTRCISLHSVDEEEQALTKISGALMRALNDIAAMMSYRNYRYQTGYGEEIRKVLKDTVRAWRQMQATMSIIRKARAMLIWNIESAGKHRKEINASTKSHEGRKMRRCEPSLRFQGQRMLSAAKHFEKLQTRTLLTQMNSEEIYGTQSMSWQLDQHQQALLLPPYKISALCTVPLDRSS